MCFGGGRQSYTPKTAPQPVASTAPPPIVETITAPTELPETPTPRPVSEDETKRKAKVTAKKVVAKQRAKGTSQLATKKPAAGGLRGVQTQQGVNTGQAAAPTKQTA